ncbi:Formin-like protein 3 [Varanus komodoensis]|nr:Formin-like protein 3 [Varanus komodoensis]
MCGCASDAGLTWPFVLVQASTCTIFFLICFVLRSCLCRGVSGAPSPLALVPCCVPCCWLVACPIPPVNPELKPSLCSFCSVCMVCVPCLPSRFDFEGLESGEDGALEKLKSWSRSIEDLQHPSTLSAPYANSLARSARQSALRYVCALCHAVGHNHKTFLLSALQGMPCADFFSPLPSFPLDVPLAVAGHVTSLCQALSFAMLCLPVFAGSPALSLSLSLSLGYTTLPSRKALKNSRLVSQKDDVHVCILCLRAIMNYQYGFNLVMSHPHAVNEIALSLNNKNPRTKALVLELLAAVCLVRGGHEIILAAFENFKEVCKEQHRFEKLMEYFRNEDSNIDFMVACMQFINIVVHSVEDMNFRVHLQYEFTKLGLEEFLQVMLLLFPN